MHQYYLLSLSSPILNHLHHHLTSFNCYSRSFFELYSSVRLSILSFSPGPELPTFIIKFLYSLPSLFTSLLNSSNSFSFQLSFSSLSSQWLLFLEDLPYSLFLLLLLLLLRLLRWELDFFSDELLRSSIFKGLVLFLLFSPLFSIEVLIFCDLEQQLPLVQ